MEASARPRLREREPRVRELPLLQEAELEEAAEQEHLVEVSPHSEQPFLLFPQQP